MLAPKVLDLNAVVTENLKMLTRLIGEDIDLVMIPGPELGAVKADPGTDRAGHPEPGGERARCHAAGRAADDRDRERDAGRGLRANARAGAARRLRHAGHHATPASAWIATRSRTSSSRSSRPRGPKGTGLGLVDGVWDREAERRLHLGL